MGGNSLSWCQDRDRTSLKVTRDINKRLVQQNKDASLVSAQPSILSTNQNSTLQQKNEQLQVAEQQHKHPDKNEQILFKSDKLNLDEKIEQIKPQISNLHFECQSNEPEEIENSDQNFENSKMYEIKQNKETGNELNISQSYEIVFTDDEKISEPPEFLKRAIAEKNCPDIESKMSAATIRRKKLLDQIKNKASRTVVRSKEVLKRKDELDSSFRQNIINQSKKKTQTFTKQRECVLQEIVDKASSFNKSVEKVRLNKKSHGKSMTETPERSGVMCDEIDKEN